MENQVQLSPEHQGRTEVLASNIGVQKALLLEDVVAVGIEEIEDAHIAAERAAAVDRGELDLLSWDEVTGDLDLDN